jgi:hypothetical protein
MKPMLGPPAPNVHAIILRAVIDNAPDPVDVIEAVLRLRDLTMLPLPVAGGMAVGNVAREHAENIEAALKMREMIDA